jgi:hypothetical protein
MVTLPMRGHMHRYTKRATKFMICGSPAHILDIEVRKQERVIYGSCIRTVLHGHPTHEGTCTDTQKGPQNS